MTATEELRRMLDERGVEYRAIGDATFWETHSGAFRYKAKPHADKLMVMTCCSQKYTVMTPAQAVEATLGRGECKWHYTEAEEYGDGSEWYMCECSVCHEQNWEPANDLPRYCRNCGAKAKR